jgi:hypothetical protein
VALLCSVAVGLWPADVAVGGSEVLRGSLVEVAEGGARRRARPPWLGRAEQARRAEERLACTACRVTAPMGPRAWLLGRRASIATLTAEDWEQLPGIGPTLVARIEARVARDGPLRRLSELDALPGIGPKRLAVLGLWLEADSPGHAVAPPGPSR